MVRSSTLVGILLLAIVGTGLLYVGWHTMSSGAEATCSVCGRPVHAESRADGVVDGREQTFCCAACALRAREQTGADVKISSVRDYELGQALAPAAAYFVVGSQINLCMREHVHMDAHKEASTMEFDRCSPSVLAFGSQTAATRFRAENGGAVQTLAELQDSYR
ncbi:MAG: organomercurial lyase [Acidobacteria bacterium]|nr:organomercurial lyase [Acidobacteriota bacterium]